MRNIPLMPRELRDIPNAAGFKLTAYNAAGEAIPAIVALGDNGLHYLENVQGHRLDIKTLTGWLPR